MKFHSFSSSEGWRRRRRRRAEGGESSGEGGGEDSENRRKRTKWETGDDVAVPIKEVRRGNEARVEDEFRGEGVL